MSDLFGELVVTMFVSVSTKEGREKPVTLTRVPCLRDDADAKFAEFKELNPRLPASHLLARWSTTVYL